MSDISAAPFVADLKPYIDVIVPPIVAGIIGWAALKFQQLTHITLQASAVASLKSAAATQAGKMVAAAEDNLAGRKFTTSSQGIVEAAAIVQAALPEAVKITGATPEAVRNFVVGEVGKLQAGTVSAPKAAA